MTPLSPDVAAQSVNGCDVSLWEDLHLTCVWTPVSVLAQRGFQNLGFLSGSQNTSVFSKAASLWIEQHKFLIYFKTQNGKSAEAKITFSRSLCGVLGPLGENLVPWTQLSLGWGWTWAAQPGLASSLQACQVTWEARPPWGWVFVRHRLCGCLSPGRGPFQELVQGHRGRAEACMLFVVRRALFSVIYLWNSWSGEEDLQLGLK